MTQELSTASSEEGLQPGPRSLRVIVADDDPDTVWTLTMILRDEGHEVHSLQKGGDVVKAIRHHRAQVAVLDLEMPEMSGYAVAQQVREAFGRQGPMLIAISGKWKGQIDRLLAKAVGFDHFLAKPCCPDDLLKLLAPLRNSPQV